MYVNGTGFEPSQSFAYEIKGNSAVILRCFSRDTRAEIPEILEGYPVIELGPYAFSAHMDDAVLDMGIRSGKVRLFIPEMMKKQNWNKDEGTEKKSDKSDAAEEKNAVRLPDIPVLAGNALEEIILPHTVRRIGRYCFYNCARLYKMTFYGMLEDWGAGAFTGVHHVGEMTVTTDPEGRTTLKQLLDELHEEITVTYLDEKGRESRLVFPEYFEEGVENTPAKIHEIRIHGSGMMYRNCIIQRRLDFRQYDSLFEHAGFLESKNMTVRLAVGRLRFPTELSDHARKQYEVYVIENSRVAADQFLKEKDLEGLKWLLELCDKKADLLQYMMEAAAKMQFTEATGFLMNFGREKRSTARKRFEL